jgi:hypothetical protein
VTAKDDLAQELVRRVKAATAHCADEPLRTGADGAVLALAARVDALEAERDTLKETLARAASCAKHLMGMTTQEMWRELGSDDGQGHYEGDYWAENTSAQIDEWIKIANG